MPLTFKDLLELDIEQTFLNVNEHAEYLILRTPCGRQRRIKGIATLRSVIDDRDDVQYEVAELTTHLSLAAVPSEPELGTAIRREQDDSDRWFSFAGPGDGEATGMQILRWIREVPTAYGGNAT